MPETVVFTGFWSGYTPGCESAFKVKLVGTTRLVPTSHSSCIILPPLRIFRHLLDFRPDVVFTSSFTLWTAFALLFRFWKGVRVVVAYDGSAPHVDMSNSAVRLFIRRVMARFADAFITNSYAGKAYLHKVLKAKESWLFARPYQVPDAATLLASKGHICLADTRRPVFLSVGEIIRGKGLHLLLEACSLLRRDGYHDWSLLIIGDGAQRSELEDFIQSHGLEDCVKWAGWVNYDNLGVYFQAADVFVFPTLGDVWGMVALEAMAFGKPILCSKWAGTAEMVTDAENGYIIDPYQPDQVANLMKRFIDNSSLIQSMGERSKQKVAPHTPEAVARHLADVATWVLNKQ